MLSLICQFGLFLDVSGLHSLLFSYEEYLFTTNLACFNAESIPGQLELVPEIGLIRVSRFVRETNFISFPKHEIVVTNFIDNFLPCFRVFETKQSVRNNWFLF